MKIYNTNGDSKIITSPFYWNNNVGKYYWCFSLDTSIKYFSVSNIKLIIDELSKTPVRQFQMIIFGGISFRLELEDMSINVNNTVYDLSPCCGGGENPNKWYSTNDMDEIIEYAHLKGIDIVPTLEMPGHMERILSFFPQFKYADTNNTLNLLDESAVNFALALLDKYLEYFANKGCKYVNVGYDEIMGWATGFPHFYNNGKFEYVSGFANKAIQTVKKYSMIPRMWNEIFHYENDFNYIVNYDCEVLYWDGSIPNQECATPQTLIDLGYTLINSNEKYYWVADSQRQVTAETLRTANFLKDFDVATTSRNGAGAMFCVWNDEATSSPNAGDNGDAVVSEVLPLITAYGEGIVHTLSLLS